MSFPIACLRTLTVGSLTLALMTGTALADELRLDDGRVLVGKVVEKKGVYEVQTRDGLVIVPINKVTKRTTDTDLRKLLAARKKNAGSTPFAYLQLSIDAHAYGLEREMWNYLDIAIKKQDKLAGKQQANEALGRRIHKFLATLEPEVLPRKWRSANTQMRVRKLIQQVRITNKPARGLAIQEILAHEPNADAALRREARRNTLEYRRVAALEALARRAQSEQAQGQNQQYRFVLRTTIFDGSERVRSAAARIMREHDQATTAAVNYLAPGLSHKNAKVRIRTAEAYAGLGNAEAINQLVMAGPTAGRALAAGGGGGTRGHIAILTQQAYVRDFDVEVAQAAFIADPKVDVLQSGTVLDVTVAGVFEERVIVRAYRRALKSLAKADPGGNPRKWATWNSERLASSATAKPASTPARK